MFIKAKSTDTLYTIFHSLFLSWICWLTENYWEEHFVFKEAELSDKALIVIDEFSNKPCSFASEMEEIPLFSLMVAITLPTCFCFIQPRFVPFPTIELFCNYFLQPQLQEELWYEILFSFWSNINWMFVRDNGCVITSKHLGIKQ